MKKHGKGRKTRSRQKDTRRGVIVNGRRIRAIPTADGRLVQVSTD